jgi:hypothetical protein
VRATGSPTCVQLSPKLVWRQDGGSFNNFGVIRMTQTISLSQDPNTTLFINPDAPLADLQHCAVQRLRAVKNLMSCLASTSTKDADDNHLAHVAEAAYLLLQDSCDVLEAMEVRLDKLKA